MKVKLFMLILVHGVHLHNIPKITNKSENILKPTVFDISAKMLIL